MRGGGGGEGGGRGREGKEGGGGGGGGGKGLTLTIQLWLQHVFNIPSLYTVKRLVGSEVRSPSLHLLRALSW